MSNMTNVMQKVMRFLCSLMDNIQQITDAVQKGILLIVRASLQQTRLRRLRIELCTDSFHAVLALS